MPKIAEDETVLQIASFIDFFTLIAIARLQRVTTMAHASVSDLQDFRLVKVLVAVNIWRASLTSLPR